MSDNKTKVLVVDDESAIRDMIRFGLEKSGMAVQCAASGQEALVRVKEQRPDIMLLDWMMSNMSGPELVRRLRKDPVMAEIPVIMLTARGSEDDKVNGLNAGADDYVVKPFSPRELVARISALLRRSNPGGEDGQVVAGAITLDTVSRQVLLEQKPVRVAPTEYRMLEFLMTHANRAYSRAQLLDHVWGATAYLEERTVDVHIRRLRKILESAGLAHYIETVRGHGYRFVAGDDPA